MISCPICHLPVRTKGCGHISVTRIKDPGMYDWSLLSSREPLRGIVLSASGNLHEICVDRWPLINRTVPGDEAEDVITYHVSLLGAREVLGS